MDIQLDEGYMYGMGLFETIAIYQGKCVLLNMHLERLNKGLRALNIPKQIYKEQIALYLQTADSSHDVLKIMVSEKNTIFSTRKNLYTKKNRQNGWILGFSSIRRNTTSPFTYFKSFHYGDSLLEKRQADKNGWDEPAFLNERGEVCEGATTNLFFVQNQTIYTPPVSCGLLNGILRQYIMQTYPVIEKIILPEEIGNYTEIFATNSLIGVMPVRKFGSYQAELSPLADQIQACYEANRINL